MSTGRDGGVENLAAEGPSENERPRVDERDEQFSPTEVLETYAHLAGAGRAPEWRAPRTAAPPPGAGLAYQAVAPARSDSPARETLAAQALAQCTRAGVDPDDDAALAEALERVELDREIPDALYAALAAILARVLKAGEP
jgi:type III secretion system FlhB-like substrate exporter